MSFGIILCIIIASLAIVIGVGALLAVALITLSNKNRAAAALQDSLDASDNCNSDEANNDTNVNN